MKFSNINYLSEKWTYFTNKTPALALSALHFGTSKNNNASLKCCHAMDSYAISLAEKF